MRILTKISGWPTEQYRNKLSLIVNILKLFEREKIIDEFLATRAVFVAYPRAVFSPAALVAPRVESEKIESTDPDKMLNAIKIVNKAYSSGNLLARYSELKFYVIMSFIEERLAGSISIRVSGYEKKHYGDIEFNLYQINQNDYRKELQFSDILAGHFSQDRYLVKKFASAISNMFKENPEIKFFTVMDYDYSMNEDYNKMLIIAHSGALRDALKSHLALIRRYIKKRTKKEIRSKYHELEQKIIKKMGGLYTFNTLLNELTSHHHLAKILSRLERTYSNRDVSTSRGSFIVIGTTGYLEKVYPDMVNLFHKLLEPFPDEPTYYKWIENGLKNI